MFRQVLDTQEESQYFSTGLKRIAKIVDQTPECAPFLEAVLQWLLYPFPLSFKWSTGLSLDQSIANFLQFSFFSFYPALFSLAVRTGLSVQVEKKLLQHPLEFLFLFFSRGLQCAPHSCRCTINYSSHPSPGVGETLGYVLHGNGAGKKKHAGANLERVAKILLHST